MTSHPNDVLRDTHILIFGGGSGIGLETARAALAAGAQVTIAGRTPEKLHQAASQLPGVKTAIADITQRTSVEAVFAAMTRVDHLVVSAGGLTGGLLADSDPDALLGAVRERLAGALYAIKAALPLLPPTGSIVLTGGQFSDRPSGNGFAVTSAAVRGIEALARGLALELKPIRVNVISPGFVDTPLFDPIGLAGRTALLDQAARALPVGRVGTPAEIAHGILFLLANGFTTAEVLHIDGGGRFV